jgi:deoxyribonuclease V
MLLALDVHYKENYAKSVGVIFNTTEDTPVESLVEIIKEVEDYVPGQFYKRELPCLLKVIETVDLSTIEAIIVDGHVYVDNDCKLGLGGYLYEALNKQMPVIGVAKRSFHNTEQVSKEVFKGQGKNPLYVSAIGLDLQEAIAIVSQLHGEHRMPTLLKLLDNITKSE